MFRPEGVSSARNNSSISLGNYPTPVERIELLGGRSLWVKRDDQTNAIYGGNKVRKLERLLADARSKKARRIVTVGAVGSHHVLATAIFAREIGASVEAVLVPQPSTPHVVENLRADLALGVRVLPASSYPFAALRIAERVARGAYYIPVGGSNLLGALAYVDAATELAAQVRAGALPEPDTVVVPLGSGGTVAGLAAGFALSGLRSRLVAVAVSGPATWLVERARTLARAAARHEAKRMGRHAPAVRIEVDRGFLGKGYGHPTDAGRRALQLARDVGLTLDLTYTAKAFASALDLIELDPQRTILYWHTLSSAPMEPWLAKAPPESELATAMRSLLA